MWAGHAAAAAKRPTRREGEGGKQTGQRKQHHEGGLLAHIGSTLTATIPRPRLNASGRLDTECKRKPCQESRGTNTYLSPKSSSKVLKLSNDMDQSKLSATDDCPTTPSKSRASMVAFSGKNGSADAGSNAGSLGDVGSLLSSKFESLPRSFQFVTLALCVFFFFGIHNVLQEAMINTEGFKFGVTLGWMEVLGVSLCSGLERSSIPCIGNGESRNKRKAPLMAYPPLTFCLLLSSSLASWSLNYINFPTKVVFRSCKLLPTMALAYFMGNAKSFSYIEIGSAIAVCAGLITFAAGDWSLSHPQFHPFGLTLVTLSVFADAILPNAQEKLFRTYDASKSEVMFFTNIYTLFVQTCSALLSGDLIGLLHFIMGKHVNEVNYFTSLVASTNTTAEFVEEESAIHEGGFRRTFLSYMVAYILISHVAVSAHTQIVKRFGGVAAVFVGTGRKGMTLILSFVIFPKESNWRYAAGAILVLGGLTVASLEKQRNRRSRGAKESPSVSAENKSGARRGNEYPDLPLDASNRISKDANENGESVPLISDLEIGRAPSSTNNRPERRR